MTQLRAGHGGRATAAAPTLVTAVASIDELAGSLASRYRERMLSLEVPAQGELRRVAVGAAVEVWLREDGVRDAMRPELLARLVDELAGFGPLEPILADPAVSEILINGVESLFVEVDGRLQPTTLRFRDAAHLRSVVERLLVGTGRRVDDGSPMVDARLADGSRLNAVVPPIAAGGPLVTIRRPPALRLGFDRLVERGTVDGSVAAFLHAAVLGRCSMVVSGGTGAGKTTLLAAVSALVPASQRIVVLEDVGELVIDHPHAVSLECRPPGRDGGEGVTLRDLVRNSLRMRPDRIVVGEVRGVEAADMLQAMNTGHEGSMTTLHANSARDALSRLESMVSLAWPGHSETTLRGWVAAAVDLVVHCERLPDGRRVVTEVAAVDGDDGIGLRATPVYRLDPQSGAAVGCGEVPRRCLERMARHGVRFPPSLFSGEPA